MAPRKKTDRASVQKAAARAENRSKTAKKADTVKVPATAAEGDKKPNSDQQERALFLHHLPKIAEGRQKIKDATNALRTLYKTAKSDGFVKADFDEAFLIQGEDGEKAKKAAIQRSLQIARWLGCDLGTQGDLFAEDARVPAVDHAYEQGKTDCLLGKSASPPYDPSLPQHARYMEGWHDATKERIEAGITKLHPEVQKDEAEKAAKKKKREEEQAKDAAAFDGPPASGVAMTREEYKRQQAAEQGRASDLLPN